MTWMLNSIGDWSDLIQTLLSVATLCVAIWAAIYAPRKIAEFSEQLRLKNEDAKDLYREKFEMFRVLMRYRGTNISHASDVLNMINVIFQSDPAVREAFARLGRYADGEENHPKRMDAYMDILVAVAKNLGFETTKAELDQGYFPK